jgi:hypothetical protein
MTTEVFAEPPPVRLIHAGAVLPLVAAAPVGTPSPGCWANRTRRSPVDQRLLVILLILLWLAALADRFVASAPVTARQPR